MIEKFGNSIGKSLLMQVEPQKIESVPPPDDSQELVKISNPAQETKVAQTMKGDLAFNGFLNRAALGAQLKQPAPVGQTSPPVGSAPPQDIARTSTLKLNSKGPEVEWLQRDLNRSRKENNLPAIPETGVYTEETEQAVKDFQKASFLPESGIADENTRLRLDLEGSREYKALDPSMKTQVSIAYAALEKDPAGRDNLLDLVRDAKFAYLLSPDAQSAAVSGLMRAPNKKNLAYTKEGLLHAAILEKNKNFEKLPEETKRNALNTMFYEISTGEFEAGNGFNGVTELVSDPNFGRLTPKQQDQFLEIVRANPSSSTPFDLTLLMEEMDNMSQAVRARAINIAHENAISANIMTGKWQENDERFRALSYLLQDPAFIQAPDEDKLAQLNGLAGRTGLEL